jgi:hypothetical protein
MICKTFCTICKVKPTCLTLTASAIRAGALQPASDRPRNIRTAPLAPPLRRTVTEENRLVGSTPVTRATRRGLGVTIFDVLVSGPLRGLAYQAPSAADVRQNNRPGKRTAVNSVLLLFPHYEAEEARDQRLILGITVAGFPAVYPDCTSRAFLYIAQQLMVAQYV